MTKEGHVTVITEYVKKGDLPPGVNQVNYGKEKVIKHFVSTNVLFLVDYQVRRTVKQFLHWLTKSIGCLVDMPGHNLVISLIKSMLSISAIYIDEAVLSYIVSQEDEKNVWRSAANGVVLYAQSWRELLRSAFLIVFITIGVWIMLL